MSFNLKYNKEFDTCNDEDFLLHVTNKLLFNWKNPTINNVVSPEAYIKNLMEINSSLSKEQLWYMIILQLLKKISNNQNLNYMNDVIKTTITYINQNKDIDMLDICENLNTSCFVLSGNCLVSSYTEDELHNGRLFEKIHGLKHQIMNDSEKYIQKTNFKKDILEEIVPKENLKNKFFDYQEFFYQMFVIYFFTSHDKKTMTGIPQTEMDIRATCFESVEQVCELFLSRNKNKVADIFCSTIAKVQLKDGD